MDWSSLVAVLEQALESELLKFPQGVDEHRLLKHLETQGLLPPCDMADSLQLFRHHFLLFHALYKLRQRLWRGRRGHLVIDALCIYLLPYEAGKEGLQAHDAMADYYLELDNLVATGRAEVDTLLQSFWTRYHASGEVSEALALMGLRPPATFSEVQNRYRRLAMQHHPDRGGDAGRLQAINRAMEVLRRHFQPINNDL